MHTPRYPELDPFPPDPSAYDDYPLDDDYPVPPQEELEDWERVEELLVSRRFEDERDGQTTPAGAPPTAVAGVPSPPVPARAKSKCRTSGVHLAARAPSAPPAKARERRSGPKEPPADLARCCTPAATRIAGLVAALGAVPLQAAVRIGDVLDEYGEPAMYKASQLLDRFGVIRRLHCRRDLNLPRVAGVDIVLLAGPRWKEWIQCEHTDKGAESTVVTDAVANVAPDPLALAAPDALIREQLALTMTVLARILAGWRLVRDDRWLGPAAELLHSRLPQTGPGVALSRALERKAHRLGPGQHIVGLLPPLSVGDGPLCASDGGSQRDGVVLPSIVVGGTWSARAEFDRAAEKLRYASPFEVLITSRSANDSARLRALVKVSQWVPKARDRITALRTDSFKQWSQTAVTLERTFASTARMVKRERLRRWIEPLAK